MLTVRKGGSLGVQLIYRETNTCSQAPHPCWRCCGAKGTFWGVSGAEHSSPQLAHARRAFADAPCTMRHAFFRSCDYSLEGKTAEGRLFYVRGMPAGLRNTRFQNATVHLSEMG